VAAVTRTFVKFCGITRPQDADAAVRLGAGAVGLVLARGSPRFLDRSRAAMIRGRLPAAVKAVALFRDAAAAEVHAAIAALAPDLLQFHGSETPEFCAAFGLPYWRAVPMQGPVDFADWERRFASAAALLLDAHAPAGAGGQGRTFDWGVIGASRPYVLAGGLTPENVGAAVTRLRPYAVDVSSGIESAPGIKDEDRMQRFMAAVRKADGE
jgi:phosphoribosylanthranilate isomerase